MNLYSLYSLPNWLFAALVVGFFTAFGVIGILLTRKQVRRLHRIDHSHNDIVGFFLGSITVFYGITLGLVTVGTWDTYSKVQERIDSEAQTIASLYRDVGNYSEPWRSELRDDLRHYTRNVIDIGWPLQRQGIIPADSSQFLDLFQQHLLAFDPKTMEESIVQTEVFKQYNVLIEIRRARLNAVTSGLPMSIWTLVVIGGLISIVVTLFFDTRSLGVHLWMTGLLSALLGLMIFLVATLDNPFRGKISVSPQSLEEVYGQLMSPRAQGLEKMPWQEDAREIR